MSDLQIVPPVPYREDGWEVIQKSTGRTLYCGLTFQRARAAVERPTRKHQGTPDGIYTVAVDLHGTLAHHRHGDSPEPIGDPLPGAKEAMQGFKDAGYRTVINSVFGDREAIRVWLDKHGIPCDYINESPWGNDTDTSGKIDADVYVDDRGLHFNGDWNDAARKVDHRARHELEKIAKRFVRKSWANVISEASKNGAISELEAAADHAAKSGIDSPEKLDELSTVLNAAGGQVLDPQHYHAALEDIAAILNDRWWNKAYEDMHAAGPSIGRAL